MKVNIFFVIISLLLSALLGYFTFSIAEGDKNGTLCGIFAGICYVATLVPTIALGYNTGRLATNIRLFSSIFFIAFVVIHLCYAYFGVKMPYYVLVNGIILVIFLAIFYKMQGNQEV